MRLTGGALAPAAGDHARRLRSPDRPDHHRRRRDGAGLRRHLGGAERQKLKRFGNDGLTLTLSVRSFSNHFKAVFIPVDLPPCQLNKSDWWLPWRHITCSNGSTERRVRSARLAAETSPSRLRSRSCPSGPRRCGGRLQPRQLGARRLAVGARFHGPHAVQGSARLELDANGAKRPTPISLPCSIGRKRRTSSSPRPITRSTSTLTMTGTAAVDTTFSRVIGQGSSCRSGRRPRSSGACRGCAWRSRSTTPARWAARENWRRSRPRPRAC